MSGVGRNDPCPCGSGKKYKKCCEGKSTRPEPQQRSATVKVPAGLPGSRIDLVLRHQWKDSQDPRNSASPQGAPGLCTLTFTLGRSAGTIAVDGEQEKTGDSLLVVAEASPALRTDLPYAGADYGAGPELIHLDGYVNARGHLAKLVATNVMAVSFADAEHKALNTMQRLASQLAVRLNVPLHIVSTDIVEAATGNLRRSLVMPYNTVRITDELAGRSSIEFSFYASLYREALNSNSPVYQFLCFYKMIDGLRVRRARLATELRARGQTPEPTVELIPSEPGDCKSWLNDLFNMRSDWGDDNLDAIIPSEVRGHKFGRIIDDHFHRIRKSIAHAVLDTGEATLMLDEERHKTHIFRWLPMAQCIARQMLRNDFRKEFAAD